MDTKAFNWIGTTTDWEGFELAKQSRWRIFKEGNINCELHNTLFRIHEPAEEGDEPCWDCWREFTHNT